MLLQKRWAELLPGTPFEYKFMDKTLEKMYGADLQLRNAVYAGAMLALIIALLGIIGLISLSLQRRAKEIGIRKVLGSSIPGIIILFVNEFLLVIISSILIASPAAYLIMKSWLNNYAYRITITLIPFIISISFLVILSILLIAVQTLKTANENPLKNLKAE
jgi:putative ABC transport system permease protein